MCDEIPEDKNPIKALIAAAWKGWMPLVVVLGKVEGGRIKDLNHVHYLVACHPTAAMATITGLAEEVFQSIIQEQEAKEWRDAHKN